MEIKIDDNYCPNCNVFLPSEPHKPMCPRGRAVIFTKTTLCERGGFEEHPESYSPRIFFSVKSTERTYELLQTGFFLSWPSLPPADFPEYMHFTIENLHCFSMMRRPL